MKQLNLMYLSMNLHLVNFKPIKLNLAFNVIGNQKMQKIKNISESH